MTVGLIQYLAMRLATSGGAGREVATPLDRRGRARCGTITVGTAGDGSLAGPYAPTNERPYFLVLGLASMIVGLILFATRNQISRLMEGVN